MASRLPKSVRVYPTLSGAGFFIYKEVNMKSNVKKADKKDKLNGISSWSKVARLNLRKNIMRV